MSHDTVGRCTSQTRKTVRLATYRLLCAVRVPPDRNKRTRQRGQRPPACWGEWEALWGPHGRAERGGRMSVEKGTCAAHARVEVLEEWVIDYAQDWGALVD